MTLSESERAIVPKVLAVVRHLARRPDLVARYVDAGRAPSLAHHVAALIIANRRRPTVELTSSWNWLVEAIYCADNPTWSTLDDADRALGAAELVDEADRLAAIAAAVEAAGPEPAQRPRPGESCPKAVTQTPNHGVPAPPTCAGRHSGSVPVPTP